MTHKNFKFIALILICFIVSGVVLAQDGNFATQASQQIQGVAGEVWQRILTATQDNIMRLVLIFGGALMLLIGWRIYNFIILIAGALTGALLAVALVNSSNTLITILAMLVGGAIGGFLAAFLYYFAVFAIGAYIGAAITIQLIISLGLQIDTLLAMIFGGIMGGLILLGLSFELLVIISSIVGGQLLALGLGLGSVWTLGFIIFGIIWQMMLTKTMGYKIRRRPTRRMLFRNA